MKKLLLLKVTFVMILFLLHLPSLLAQSYWNGTSSQDWTGSGTESDPYLITTAEQLAGLAQAVNGGRDFKDEFIQLNNDLWLSDPSASHGDKPQWTPIGGIVYEGEGWEYKADTTYFRGTFDGANHTVYNLYYNTLPDMSDWDDPFGSGTIDFNGWYKAMFGYLEGGKIKNLHLVNDTIIGAADIAGLLLINDGGTVSGCSVSGFVVSGSDETGGSAGGLIGYNLNGGIVENCTSAADVKAPRGAGCLINNNDGILRDCSASGKAYCTQYYVGGLVAYNSVNGEITRCHSTGYVSRANYTHAIEDCGGFIGSNLGLIRECWSSATVNSDKHGAGFCGLNGGRIESCYATGDVTIRTFGTSAATFVGANGRPPVQALDPIPYEGVCINCFATGKCQSENEGTLYGFLSNYQSQENRATLTAFCTTDADRYPYNDLGVNKGGVAPGIKGGALRRSTALMQSRAFVDTLNMVAAVAGTCLWKHREGDYPIPTGEKADITLCFPSGGDGTEENPFRIRTKTDLERLAALVNLGWTFQNQHLRLENDIALNVPFEEWSVTAPIPWIPIGKKVEETTSAGGNSFAYEFRGTFNGEYHSIKNMYINTVQDVTPQGFFGLINGATIKNLNVTDAWVKAEGTPSILVGESSRYCMPTHILQCHTSGRVEGSWSSGATLGAISLEGSTNIINCSSSATLIKGSHSANPVVGDQNYIGGSAYSNDTVANFYFTGIVENYSISYDNNIKINCYYNSDLNKGSDGGRTTTYLQSREFVNELNYYVAQYNELNNENPLRYWQSNEGDYPTLTASVPPHTITYHTNIPNLTYTPQPVLDDSYILPPPEPTNNGQLFYGWFTDEQLTRPYIFDTTRVNKSFPLYAKWQAELEPDITPFTSNPFATTYIINTPEQLYGFALAIDGKENVIDRMDFTGKTVKLGADIMLNDTAQWRQFGKNIYGRVWAPLASNYVNDIVFRGTFDGDGHTISGMYINIDDFNNGWSNRIGLFGTIAPEAIIRNLRIKASRIIANGKYGSLGLLAGCNRGTVENCHVEGEIDAACCTAGLLIGVSTYEFGGIGLNNGIGRIVHSSAQGCIYNSDATWEISSGGLVGSANIMNDSIIDCTAQVSVIHEGSDFSKNVGGLIGYINNTVVKNCSASPYTLYAMENVGGLVGLMDKNSALIGCHTNCNLQLNINYLGGLAGRVDDGKLIDCHTNSQIISSGDYIGGLVGFSVDTISNCSADGFVSGRDYVGGIAGSVTGMRGCCYSSISSVTVLGNKNVGSLLGYGSAVDSHASGNVTGDTNVGGLVGYGSTLTDCLATGNVSGKRYVGGLSGISSTVNGSSADGHVDGTSYVGGLLGTGSMVDSCYARGTVIAVADTVGGLVGWHQNGQITRSHASGSVIGRHLVGGFVGYTGGTSITQSSSSGDVQGEDYVGGFLGQSKSSPVVSLCYSMGMVTGHDYVGGFSGNGDGTDCFAHGSVSGNDYVGGFAGEVLVKSSRCYSIGTVNAIGEHVSGFGTKRYQNYIKDSYFNHETSGLFDLNGAKPRPTIYMKNKFNYQNWDFEATWGRNDAINDGYPYLRWIYDSFIEDDTDTILPSIIEEIRVSPTAANLHIGDSITVKIELLPSDAVNQDIIWKSENDTIATVNENGTIKAMSEGTTNIIVISKDGYASNFIPVKVSPVAVESISFANGEKPIIVAFGEKYQLSLIFTPENSSNKKVTWNCSEPKILSIDENGVITAGAIEGTATVTAKSDDGGHIAQCTVQVLSSVPVSGIKIDERSKISSIYFRDSIQLIANILPENATNKNVLWKLTGGSNILNLTSDGLLIGIKPGFERGVQLTVSSEDGIYTDSFYTSFTVKAKPGQVTGVVLNHTSETLTKGDSLLLIATVEPEDAINKDIIWESSDTTVAQVNIKGLVSAVNYGHAIITARNIESGVSATCEIFVDDSMIPATGIQVTPTEITLKERESAQLIATILPENATNKKVIWESSNTNVISVDSLGYIIALKEGVSTISVCTADREHTAICNVTVLPNSTDIDDLWKDNLYIYPNPVMETLTVEGNGFMIYRLDVINTRGRIVLSCNDKNVINVSHLPDGIYIVRISTDKGDILRKVIKVK